MVVVNKKLKFVIPQQVNIIWLLLLQILAIIENYQHPKIGILHITFKSVIHFVIFVCLPLVHLKRACEVAICIF